jgi:hypothetical protein
MLADLDASRALCLGEGGFHSWQVTVPGRDDDAGRAPVISGSWIESPGSGRARTFAVVERAPAPALMLSRRTSWLW